MAVAPSFELTFYGVRGSRPVSDRRFLTFGGNTSCVGVNLGGVHTLFDAGTGIALAGPVLARETGPLAIFLSHLHHDHLMGLLFFDPLFQEGREIGIYVPEGMVDAFHAYWAPPYFPIGPLETAAQVTVHPVAARAALWHDGASWLDVERRHDPRIPFIHTLALDSQVHPAGGIMLYRVTHRGKTAVYCSDVEFSRVKRRDELLDFVGGADVLICDCQYTDAEYQRRYAGFGHNSLDMVIDLVKEARVRKLVLFHHDASRDDAAMRSLETEARRRFLETTAAREGLRIQL